ncbi:Alkaline phosphatase synthesis sensor protein PhoR [compost metagenome]
MELLEKMWEKTKGNSMQLVDPQQMELSLEAMHDISGEAQRMSRLVNDLLALARADTGVVMDMQALEIKPLVDEVVRRAQFLPRTAEWLIGDLHALEGAWVQGNRDYLQQLLFIFIENAFKYTPNGHVKLDTLWSGEEIGIRITDSGIGMEKDEIPHIFERFYRADLSRGQTMGTGLGLAIAKWIIDEHDGTVEVMTRKDEGSTFIVWLPASFPHTSQ